MFPTSLFLAALVSFAPAQNNPPQPGKIVSIDAGKRSIVLASNGAELLCTVNDKTRFIGADGKPLNDGLKDKSFQPGTEVMFKADGNNVLIGLKLGRGSAPAKIVKFDSSKLVPLPELGEIKYHGYPGGLYPQGRNERPTAHEKAGLTLAQSVQSLDDGGKPDDGGKIGLLSVGMSNTTQEFSTFKKLADADKLKNPKLIVVDGVQGGQTAAKIQDPDDKGSGTNYWAVVDQRLKAAGLTREQVQVAWIKQADAGPTSGFPKYAETLRDELRRIVQKMHERFPNLKLVYLSSRIDAGFAKSALNPEPYAYESGFAVKWLIEEQLDGKPSLNFDPMRGAVQAPWLSWGPYIWVNGANKRGDGLMYELADFGNDGTHPSESGRRKVAEQLLNFFKNDSTTRKWFTVAPPK